MLLSENLLRNLIKQQLIYKLLKENDTGWEQSPVTKTFKDFILKDMPEIKKSGIKTISELLRQKRELANSLKQACMIYDQHSTIKEFILTIKKLIDVSSLQDFISLASNAARENPSYILGHVNKEKDFLKKLEIINEYVKTEINERNSRNEKLGIFAGFSDDQVNGFNNNFIKILQQIARQTKIWQPGVMTREIELIKKQGANQLINNIAIKPDEAQKILSNFQKNNPVEIILTNIFGNKLKQTANSKNKTKSVLFTAIMNGENNDVVKRIIKTYNYRKQNKTL